MSNTVLLRVTTDSMVFDVTGPRSHKHLEHAERPDPVFSVTADTGTLDVLVAGPEGDLVRWSPTVVAPAFYEDVTYRFFAKSTSSSAPVNVRHRDRTLLKELDHRPADGLVSGTINFGRQVGLSDFVISVGAQSVKLTVEVLPTKLDFRADYDALLDSVRAANESLVLEHLRATYRLATTARRPSGEVEWLALLRDRMAALEQSVQTIAHRPHRALRPALEDRRPERLRRFDSTAMNAVRRGRGSGPWSTIPHGPSLREFIPSRTPAETLDTPEHRWIAQELRAISLRLRSFELSFSNAGRNDVPTERALMLRDEVRGLMTRIKKLSQVPPLLTRGSIPVGFTSLQLTSALGYADAYRNLNEIRRALNLEDGLQAVSISDLHDLYEKWCFLEVVRQLQELTGSTTDLSEIIQTRKGLLGVSLVKGKRSRVRMQRGQRRLEVVYNPRFPGLSGDQIPDIVIRIQRPGLLPILIALDAKYRIDSSSAYRKQFGTTGPPRDALNALHRYRDAITENQETYAHRPVARGVALFPLSAGRSGTFRDSKLQKSLDVQGIGALPFLPGNTDLVRHWLREILSLSDASLALSGPPYPGLTSSEVTNP
jgi:hypothetical protein